MLIAAFAIWAANFLIGYAGALLVPEHVAAKLLLVVLGLVSIPMLYGLVRRARGLPESEMVRAGVIVGGLAILFNAAVALA